MPCGNTSKLTSFPTALRSVTLKRGDMMSFKNELHHAIQFRPGTQKREVKASEGRQMSHRIYSYAERDALHDLANNFSHWVRENRPDLRHVKDITYEDKMGFLESCRARGCTPATVRAYENRLDKLGYCCNRTYPSSRLDYMERSYCRETQRDRDRYEERIRTQVMTREDYNRLHDSCTRSSRGRDGLELGREFGLRAREIVTVRVEDVREDRLVVHGKGGRDRELPIETQGQRDLLDRLVRGRDPEERLIPICVGSYENYVRDHLHRSGLDEKYPDTGQHSIRKMCAQERYFEERGRGLSPEEAASEVTKWLGHGADRADLIEVYLAGVYGR